MRQVRQTARFEKAYKKLKINQRRQVDEAVAKVAENPALGEMKKGDLQGVRVYKFRMLDKLALLAYFDAEEDVTIILLALGADENFYRDLKH